MPDLRRQNRPAIPGVAQHSAEVVPIALHDSEHLAELCLFCHLPLVGYAGIGQLLLAAFHYKNRITDFMDKPFASAHAARLALHPVKVDRPEDRGHPIRGCPLARCSLADQHTIDVREVVRLANLKERSAADDVAKVGEVIHQ